MDIFKEYVCNRTFLCLHSSHLGKIFSLAIILFLVSGSDESPARDISTSTLSSVEGVAGEGARGVMTMEE